MRPAKTKPHKPPPPAFDVRDPLPQEDPAPATETEPEPVDQETPRIGSEKMDTAMAALDTWLELGEDFAPALRLKRQHIVAEMEKLRASLEKIDQALSALGVSATPPPAAPPEPERRRRSQDRVAYVRSVVADVVKEWPDGLSAGQVAAQCTEADASVDRYEVNSALTPMHSHGEIVRTGKRGSFLYHPPPTRQARRSGRG